MKNATLSTFAALALLGLIATFSPVQGSAPQVPELATVATANVVHASEMQSPGGQRLESCDRQCVERCMITQIHLDPTPCYAICCF